MNSGLIRQTLGKILLIEALFMCLPIFIAIYYKEGIGMINSFTFPIVLLLLVAFPLLKSESNGASFNTKDGYILVSLSWFALSFFGAIPYYISNQIPHFPSALFESVSGFTTSGASVLINAETFPNCMHFWRSFTQFIGGMGIVVFALAILNTNAKGTLNIMRAEVPGPEAGKVVSRVGPTAKILYSAYVALTLVVMVLLILAGMRPFDAIIHAMGATSTGGFSNKNSSVGHYESPLIELIITGGMFLSGVNFNIYFLMIIGRAREILRSEEFRFYCTSITLSVIAIIFITLDISRNIIVQIKDILFSVVSIATTTGFTTIDYTEWPLATHIILLALFFIGGCTGSTAGGLKMARALALVKSGIRSIKKSVNPRRVITISESKNYISDNKLETTQSYLVIYIIAFAIILFLVSLEVGDFDTSFSMTISAINNNSPSFAAVGPETNYYDFGSFTKLILSLAMIVGRLEIIPVLLLLFPETYERR